MTEQQVSKGYEIIQTVNQINKLLSFLPAQWQQPMDLQDYDVDNLNAFHHRLLRINTKTAFDMYKLAIKNELLELKRNLEKELEEL